MECDPAYAPAAASQAVAALGAPTEEANRRSDSLPLEARGGGGSMTGRASMSSQASQQPIKPLSLATIASRLAPQDSLEKSPKLSHCQPPSVKPKEPTIKAKVSFICFFRGELNNLVACWLLKKHDGIWEHEVLQSKTANKTSLGFG